MNTINTMANPSNSVSLNEECSNGAPPNINISSKLYAIKNIDSARMTFQLEFAFYVHWTLGPQRKYIKWSPKLNSNFYLQDALETVILDESDGCEPDDIKASSKGEEDCNDHVDDSVSTGSRVRKFFRVRATLSAKFDLVLFPKDHQTIEMRMRIPRTHQQGIETVAARDESPEIKQLRVENSWRIVTTSAEVVYRSPLAANKKPEYIIRLGLQRNPAYFVRNIYVPNLLIAFLHFVVFLLPAGELVDTISICLTVLLTLVAFKLTVSAHIPVLDYNTSLDVMLSAMMTFVVVSCILCTLAYLLDSASKSSLQLISIPLLSYCPSGTELKQIGGMLMLALFCVYNLKWYMWLRSAN